MRGNALRKLVRPFNGFLLSIYYVLGILLGIKNVIVDKTGESLVLMSLGGETCIKQIVSKSNNIMEIEKNENCEVF